MMPIAHEQEAKVLKLSSSISGALYFISWTEGGMYEYE